jgi:hypothetical protein
MTVRVSQMYGCQESFFGGEGLLLFIVGRQNKQQINKFDRKSAESVATVR